MVRTLFAVVVTCVLIAGATPPDATAGPSADGGATRDPATLESAQRLFYSALYEEAAAVALAVRSADDRNLAAAELRSSALLFQIRRAFGAPSDRERAWKACGVCQELMTAFLAELDRGREAARVRLNENAADVEARFFLGKLNLNYVWLQLGTLGRKTGWGEYWEARKSLDAVLKADPEHVRARVARAWIDYIVDTRVPRGVRWMLGGGNRRRGIETLRSAADAGSPRFVQAEAMFALWDMQVRERNMDEAIATARALVHDFPANAELTRFLEAHDLHGSR